MQIIKKCFYEILDIIRKIWKIITPIMTFIFFNMPSQQQLINMQIIYTVFNGKTSLWALLHTYCIKIILLYIL